MNLLEKLVEIPQRESSGSLTSNRYDYQYNWSLLKLLEITKSLKDFLIVFEFCEDTIVLDSATKPQNIDFYQVKTNKQQNKLNWIISHFTKKKKDSNEESIVEKLIDYGSGSNQNLEVTVIASDINKITKICNIIKNISGVNSANITNYSNGRANITVKYSGTPQNLYNQLNKTVDFNVVLKGISYNTLSIGAY